MRDRDKPNYHGDHGYSREASGRGNGERGRYKSGSSNFANDDCREIGASKMIGDIVINTVCIGIALAASYFFVAQLIANGGG